MHLQKVRTDQGRFQRGLLFGRFKREGLKGGGESLATREGISGSSNSRKHLINLYKPVFSCGVTALPLCVFFGYFLYGKKVTKRNLKECNFL